MGACTKILDGICFLYFFTHIPITILVDSQAVLPKSLYPKPVSSQKVTFLKISRFETSFRLLDNGYKHDCFMECTDNMNHNAVIENYTFHSEELTGLRGCYSIFCEEMLGGLQLCNVLL